MGAFMKKIKDHYFRIAKKESYPARSVYKLKEMEKRFRLFHQGQKVLDLGASPGSWSMFASRMVTPSGRVVAVDLKEPAVSFPEHVDFIRADIFEDQRARDQVRNFAPFDLILSDMAPRTTGIKITDQARSCELAREAFLLGRTLLNPGGCLVIKVFEGPDVQLLSREMKKCFERVRHFKPKSSRSESRELFIIGMVLQGKDAGKSGPGHEDTGMNKYAGTV